jgi:nucleotide-binding universal stress UspA family protein
MRAHHLLVGYDGSDFSKHALRAACELAKPDGVLTVVHAYEVPWQIDAYPWFKDFKNVTLDLANEVLESAKEISARHPGTSNFRAEVGKPADVLAQLARSEKADLIVVGARGLGPVLGAVGSVTYRLLHRSGIPVLVIPKPEPGA